MLNDCAIGERKNMNLPGVVVDLPVLQEKDTEPRRVRLQAARASRGCSCSRLTTSARSARRSTTRAASA